MTEHHLDARFAPRLLKAYGADAPKVLSSNPYRLVGEVPGLGFATAHRLGRSLGVRPGAVARLQAAAHAALLRAAERGHTRLADLELITEAAALGEVDVQLVEPTLIQLQSSGLLSRTTRQRPAQPAIGAPDPVTISGRLRIYAPAAEPPSAPATDTPCDAGLGIGLSGLVRARGEPRSRHARARTRPVRADSSRVDAWLAVDADAQTLSEQQREAVRTAALGSCFVLTGGPGVGKTTTVRVLVRCFEALGRSVALAAPTGKAAKRLGEVVGREARTVHRLLGAGPNGFQHGKEVPLEYDVVIVDEASMLDTQLAQSRRLVDRPDEPTDPGRRR